MIAAVLEIIEQKTGTVLKDSRLERTQKFLEELDMTPQRVFSMLKNEPLDHPLWQQIIERITVGETYFFRNEVHFRALQYRVFPELINQRRQQKQHYLRIWIAGCATGEEAYSIAILLREILPDIDQWSIFILATDINGSFLSYARQGVYRERAFRNETPDYVQKKWFTPQTQGYEIKPVIRQMVTFSPLNLMDDTYPMLENNTTALDLILCRNVTIYFDRPTTQRIVNRFYNALANKGWLLVGHAEPQPHVYDAFSMCNIDGAIFYQKQGKPKPEPEVYQQPAPVIQAAEVVKPIKQPVISTSIAELIAQAQQAADKENWDIALELISQVEKREPFNPTAHYLRGLVFTHTNRPELAIEAFGRATYCDPQFVMAHFALGELLFQSHKKDEASASWRRAHKALKNRSQDEPMMENSDLTVGMLLDLLTYRLRK